MPSLPKPDDPELTLARGAGGLGIVDRSGRTLVTVDFLDPESAWRRRGISLRTHPMARAIGRARPLPAVLDCTAGLGRDAFVLAYLGYRVTAFERSPILHALLVDGLDRLQARQPELVDDRLRIESGDATARLGREPPPEVVYIDPMFPRRRKSALVKQEMRILQRLVQDDEDGTALVAAARAVATDRVVVKRPTDADGLAPDPSYTVTAKKVRWDVYLRPTAG